MDWAKKRQSHLDSAGGYMDLGMHEDALSEVEKILAVDPNDATAQELKCIFLAQMKKFDIAEDALVKLIKIHPDNPDLYIQLAFARRRTKGLDAAIEAIINALKINPYIAVANYNLACYYSMKNDIENALKYLENAIRLDPIFAIEALKDEDFLPIAENPRFIALIQAKSHEKKQEN